MKEKIQECFVNAMKEKNGVAKSALSGLKTEITKAEKNNKNIPLDEKGILDVVVKCIKQRDESYSIYIGAGRNDLAEIEQAEIDVLKQFLPQQMTEVEIETAVLNIMGEFDYSLFNEQAKIGKIIGAFNKEYKGRANIDDVKSVVNKVVSR